MVYTRKFISSLTKVVNLSFGSILLADLIDDIVQFAEDRVVEDLQSGLHFSGQMISYTTLLSVDAATFTPMLEYAAIFAILSWYNINGKNNKAVGPIIAASGDGMAKTQGYYNSKGVNQDALVTAEESYLAKIKQIYRVYMSKIKRKTMLKRYNEHYDADFNANYYSQRKIDGNV